MGAWLVTQSAVLHPATTWGNHQKGTQPQSQTRTHRLNDMLRGVVGYARLSSSTGMVRIPAVWRAYSAKPG